MTVDGTNSNEQVILVTGGYDHTIKIWQPHTGICQRTAEHTDSVIFTYIYCRKYNPFPLKFCNF